MEAIPRPGPTVVGLGSAGRAFVEPRNLRLRLDRAKAEERVLIGDGFQPVGVGDLTSGLFLARLLLGEAPCTAFEFTAAAVHEVLLETQHCGSYELELVRAQDRIAHPRVRFEAKAI